MGANAQTTVPTFTLGQVLTAAQMNDSARTGVPVFAGTSERDAGFGGSGEKVLAEGQLCYLESTDVVQQYNGSSWVTVGPATPGGLVCVKAETAFSAVASATADGVFTSTYTNYQINVRYQTSLAEIAFQLGAATVYAATNYNYQRFEASSTSLSGTRVTGNSVANIGEKSSGAFFNYLTLELSGPQLAAATVYTCVSQRSAGAYTTPGIYIYNGNHSDSTSYDGIKLQVSSGDMTGSYTIYGYSKTV
jgi:hypothetical protein